MFLSSILLLISIFINKNRNTQNIYLFVNNFIYLSEKKFKDNFTQQYRLPKYLITSHQLMKHNNKVSAQKYLRRRDSFQSPQFSTVIEVNPSCQSEQSMLQKIIYPGRKAQININNCDSKPYKKSVLTQRNSNVFEFRKDKISNDKDQINLKHYQSQDKRSVFQSQRQIKKDKFNSKPINIDFQKQNYESQPQFYQSQQQYSSSSSLIDQQKLHKIQQKIRNHQMKKNNNKENQQVFQRVKRSFHDTMEKQLSKIQIYDSDIKLKKKPTIIDKIKDQRLISNKKDIVREEIRTFQCQPVMDRFTKNAKKCLQTIYDLVVVDSSSKLSPSNINLKNSIKEQIKLVLGPIFADVTIKGKSISKEQFVNKANQILSNYRDQEIEEIFFSIVNGLCKNSKDYHSFSKIQEKKSVQLTRVPGKLLKNSKTGCEAKQRQKNQENIRKDKQYFSNFEICSNYSTKRSIDHEIAQRVSKKVYIEQTEKTEPQQIYQSSKQKMTKRYDTRINLNHQTLEIMLNEQKSKRQYSSTLEKKNNYESKVPQDDDQLERLNNLQKRFNEHFRNKGAV